MAASTVTRYETALKHLREFMQAKYRLPDYPIQAINHKFIKDFEHYLLTVRGCNAIRIQLENTLEILKRSFVLLYPTIGSEKILLKESRFAWRKWNGIF